MKKKILLVIIVFLAIIFLPKDTLAGTGYDDPATPHYEKGNITWTTLDDAAVRYPTWETRGFTLRPDKCLPGGNPRKDNNYATLMLKDGWKIDVPIGNGKTNTTFKIPKDDVAAAVDKAKVTPQTLKDNSYYIFLNGIFRINYSSTKYSSLIYTLNGIMYPGTVSWSTPGDFRDRFDVPVKFDPEPQPVQVKYMELNSGVKSTIKTIKNTDSIWAKDYTNDPSFTYQEGCGLGFKEYEYPTLKEVKTNGESIPLKKSKIVNGVTEEYYLYRVHWSKLTDKLNTTASGSLRKVRDLMMVQTNPLSDYTAYTEEVKTIRNRAFVVQHGGIEIVAVYKKFKPPAPGSSDTTISKEFDDPVVSGMIEADYYSNRLFSVQEGIPTTESVYATVSTDQQTLINYTFKKYSGTKTYQQKKLDEAASQKEKKEIYIVETVSRNFSYYTVEQMDIYTLDKAVINNYCLPGGTATINAVGNVTIASFNYSKYAGESGHLKEPEENVEEVEQIQVRNDKVVINGITVISDEWKETTTAAPNLSVFTSLSKTSAKGPGGCLYRSNLTIDALKSNGDFDSDGTLYYKLAAHIGASSEPTLAYEIDDINNVIIHTPTICDPLISNIKEFNQLLVPDQSRASLVLDRTFTVKFPTYGTHLDILGYGTRDYAKYILSRQVKFPFDVYINLSFYPKNTWISITNEITEFYLPIWVDEGSYSIDARSISINAIANDGILLTEELANYEYSNYVATDIMDVEVSGRVYGLQLYDISDYPTWENVFRQKNSLKPSGFNYAVGVNDRNGVDTGRIPKYTLTPVNGSHPLLGNIGAIKTGYVTRFSLKTIGNMYGSEDVIWIRPKFYYVDAKGNNRQEVDIYYSETINGKKMNLVRAGSELDKQNLKAFRLGDPYLGVPEIELTTKAALTGLDIKTIKGVKENLFSFTNMVIKHNLRTFIGTNYTPTGMVPDGVSPSKVTASMQKWYGEYYLPSEIHAAPKGFDVYGYARNHYGLDYKENFWLKDGYIIVNFDIETINENYRHLSYINSENALNGYCNMWNKEGYQYTKTDYRGNVFNFLDGDYVMYYTNKSAAKDYKSGGTH